MRAIDTIVLHHTASREGTMTWEQIRDYHMGKGWSDVGYHHGIIHRTTGWGWEVVAGRRHEVVGAHAKGHNETSIGVVFEGNFEDEYPHPEQLELGIDLVFGLVVAYGVAVERVLGHRELPYATACPGRWFPLEGVRGALRDRLRWKG